MKYILVVICLFSHILQADSVAVSVAPYLEIVQEIAGPSIEVHLVVPQGASSHSFETTPKQLQALSHDTLWFTIGEPFEYRAIKALKQSQPAPTIINLREGLNLIQEHVCEHHSSADPHIWMDPEMMATQVQHIIEALKNTYPLQSAEITERSDHVLQKLKQLQNLRDLALKGKKGTLIVSHPAYGYLLRAYDILEYALEFEGKEPSAKQLALAVDKVTEAHAHTIFTQPQYSKRAADRIASLLNLQIIELDPYSPSYFESMNTIYEAFAKELTSEMN